MPEASAQLAPGHQHAGRFEEADRHGPDDPLGARALLVGVADGQFPALVQRAPQKREIDGLRPVPAVADHQGVVLHALAQVGGKDGGDFGHHVAGRLSHPLVGAPPDPLQAERQRLDLLGREHEGREQEAGLQHIAEPRLALDLRAHGLERGDVAIERAQRNPRLPRQHRPAHRAAVTAEDLQEIEKAFGAGHGLQLSTGCCQIVTAGSGYAVGDGRVADCSNRH